eukprot:scaffold757_cov74-Cylindrotheca_fusiformis.AAC.5
MGRSLDIDIDPPIPNEADLSDIIQFRASQFRVSLRREHNEALLSSDVWRSSYSNRSYQEFLEALYNANNC